MKTIQRILILLTFTFAGCTNGHQEAVDYQKIAHELLAMRETDQEFNNLLATGDPRSKEDGFSDQMNQMYLDNTSRMVEIFKEIGYPSTEQIGPEAADAFWILVQHSDSNPEFQEKAASAMKQVVKNGGAKGDKLAYLTDRYLINTGRAQQYGTQLDYDMDLGKAFPKSLASPRGVDQRRAEVGLAPLWEYMNEVCEMHFSWNEEHYRKLGVTEPWTYPEGYLDW